MMTSVELSAIHGRLTALRERLDHCDDEDLVEVQWARDADWDITRLLAELESAHARSPHAHG